MTNLTLEEFEARFEALGELLHTAENALSEGRIVQFLDLEEEMNNLCEAAEKAPPEIAAQLRTPMAQMISTLDGLATKLEDFKAQQERERKT